MRVSFIARVAVTGGTRDPAPEAPHAGALTLRAALIDSLREIARWILVRVRRARARG